MLSFILWSSALMPPTPSLLQIKESPLILPRFLPFIPYRFVMKQSYKLCNHVALQFWIHPENYIANIAKKRTHTQVILFVFECVCPVAGLFFHTVYMNYKSVGTGSNDIDRPKIFLVIQHCL